MNKETLEEVLTFYESKSNEELLKEVQDIYYSYPVSGGIRRRNFYNRIKMNDFINNTDLNNEEKIKLINFINDRIIKLCD